MITVQYKAAELSPIREKGVRQGGNTPYTYTKYSTCVIIVTPRGTREATSLKVRFKNI